MYKLLIACRAGVGSSLMLKIKTQQVIKENNFPIEVEHGSLDSLNGFVDRNEIKTALEKFLASKEK